MGVKIESEDKVTGVGWVQSGVWSARDVLEHIGDGTLTSELERDEPEYYRYSDNEKFKVTITVERV